jgi:uroporphyrin-III C-methyltransferase/precorrin-2 dehydrogenase/sirohydrochlorin ferrochelatase
LLAAGAAPSTSVVIVENGTLPTERAVATTLQDLSDAIAQLDITVPAVIFVGLDWQDAGLQRPAAVTVYRRQRTVSRPAIAAQTAEVIS